jgi:hypothetical protein
MVLVSTLALAQLVHLSGDSTLALCHVPDCDGLQRSGDTVGHTCRFAVAEIANDGYALLVMEIRST